MYMAYFYIVGLDTYLGNKWLIITFLYIISIIYMAYYAYICIIKQFYESFFSYSYT